eukprot:3589392-Pyramimonas_sp.AAC.1
MGMIYKGWCGVEESGASVSPHLASLSSLSSIRRPSPHCRGAPRRPEAAWDGAYRRAYTEAFKAEYGRAPLKKRVNGVR